MHILRVDVNKPQREFLLVLRGRGMMAKTQGPCAPASSGGRGRKDVHRDLLGTVRNREKHIPLSKKGICLQEKWSYWGEMSNLMKLTNSKENKLSLQNVRKTVGLEDVMIYNLLMDMVL